MIKPIMIALIFGITFEIGVSFSFAQSTEGDQSSGVPFLSNLPKDGGFTYADSTSFFEETIGKKSSVLIFRPKYISLQNAVSTLNALEQHLDKSKRCTLTANLRANVLYVAGSKGGQQIAKDILTKIDKPTSVNVCDKKASNLPVDKDEAIVKLRIEIAVLKSKIESMEEMTEWKVNFAHKLGRLEAIHEANEDPGYHRQLGFDVSSQNDERPELDSGNVIDDRFPSTGYSPIIAPEQTPQNPPRQKGSADTKSSKKKTKKDGTVR